MLDQKFDDHQIPFNAFQHNLTSSNNSIQQRGRCKLLNGNAAFVCLGPNYEHPSFLCVRGVLAWTFVFSTHAHEDHEET